MFLRISKKPFTLKNTRNILLLLFALQLLLCGCGNWHKSEIKTEQQVILNNPIILEGTYQGKNLYIQNPLTEDCFCTRYVTVNGVTLLDSNDVQKTAFEIDLTSLSLDTGSVVKIEIFHHSDCRPKVLYPEIH